MAVRGRSAGRVNVAGVLCFRPGERAHLFYALHTYRGTKGEAKSFRWWQYRDLIISTHHQLGGAPLVWCWDNLNVHLARELADFAAANSSWLRVVQLPTYAPELNPAEGVWSLLKRAIANFVAADLDGLVRIIKRKLKKIQYRPHLLDGCLAASGLVIEPW
ncbi:transposase [Planobispora siamensis]|uniref:transposase n=1 Tax=Planobispora siamensis TaxID=936338 RepID=UPI001950E8FD|nr:transposase [Planobispora siamensis]